MTRSCLAGLLLVALAACAKPAADVPVHRHEHHPPHGGTPVVLGDEAYHLELVLSQADGRLDAYILDGEMENFVRAAMPSFEAVAAVGGEKRILVFQPVANPATGETAGDTSCFSARAPWLRNAPQFDAVLTRIEVRGTAFAGVAFNFPRGNDRD